MVLKKATSVFLVFALLFNFCVLDTIYAKEKQDVILQGLKTSIAKSYDESITDTVSVYPNKSIKVKLQCYDRKSKTWVTKNTTTSKNGKAKLKYPEFWKKHLITYWRIYCPETKTTKAYKSKKITIVLKNYKKPKLNCESFVVMEKNSKQVVISKNMNSRKAIGSTTKLMTALLTYENCELKDIVTISKEATKTPHGILDLKANDKYYVSELLEALLIPSANDSAVALGCYISGSEKQFVKKMNTRAAQLGLKNTQFVTPYGLDRSGHYSSAYDLSVIHSMLINYDEFLQIEREEGCAVRNVSGDITKSFKSTNPLLSEYKKLISGKTGTTRNAKSCFSGAYKYNGTIYIFTILGADTNELRWKDAKTIIKYIRTYA